MLCFDGERVGSPPFESLARQKHCRYEQGGGGGVATHSDTVVPAHVQKRVNWPMKSACLFLECHFCIMSQEHARHSPAALAALRSRQP